MKYNYSNLIKLFEKNSKSSKIYHFLIKITLLFLLISRSFFSPAFSQINPPIKLDEIELLFKQSVEYINKGNLNQALEMLALIFQKARELNNKEIQAKTLYQIGKINEKLNHVSQALDIYQKAFNIYREIGDRQGESQTLYSIGSLYYFEKQYTEALKFLQQSLVISQELNQLNDIATTLNRIGVVHYEISNYEQALDVLKQALTIFQHLENEIGEGNALNNIGLIYEVQGEYSNALYIYQQSLAIFKKLNKLADEADLLNNIGIIYRHLGEYTKALELYNQALATYQAVGDRASISMTLHNLGFVYEHLDNVTQALNHYQQSLTISREIKDRIGEARTLNNLALLEEKRGNYQQARQSLTQALAIVQKSDNQDWVSRILDSLGSVYQSLGQYDESFNAYYQALVIRHEIGNRPSERNTLSNLGDLLVQQNQPELAIVFYKRSVNVTESIRQDIQALPRAQQQSYTNTVADTYRRLADLLLQQNRVLEAQQILDLLKIQEIDDYFKEMRGNEQTSQGADLLPSEQRIAEITDRSIQLGIELRQLEKIPLSEQTLAQQQKFSELQQAQRELLVKFNDFVRSPTIQSLVQQLRQTTEGQNIELKDFRSLQRNLREIKQNTVLLYPLILEDRLELVLVSPDSLSPVHYPVPVKREELNRAILEFRTALTDKNSDVEKPARQLYEWLIKPLEKDLAQANTKVIIYAPDGQLRYIPLAALHDGKQWLVERYQINHITALSLTNLNRPSPPTPRILAAAFSEGRHNFKVGPHLFGLDGLRFAGVEVENLAATIPDTKKLLNSEFNRPATIPYLNSYNIVHLATHAMFVIGQPEDSFILLGDGDRLTLRDLETLTLPDVDLVVLSACQTGYGGISNGDGKEILGLGYQIQNTGAKAAIASLWSVSDGGTQILMNEFYQVLKSGSITKAEALQTAQIALINRQSSDTPLDLKHPYYWAAFFLIGNGL